jgi:hypothetical protein
VFRIDREDRTVKAPPKEVLGQHGADRRVFAAGTDHSDRFGLQQIVQIADAHENVFRVLTMNVMRTPYAAGFIITVGD